MPPNVAHAPYAGQRHARFELAAENLNCLGYPRLASRSQSKNVRTRDEATARTECQGTKYILSSSYATIEQHL